MDSKKLLVYFSRKYKGDWDQIFRAIKDKEEYEIEDVEKASRNVGSRFITIFDDEYPEFLKTSYKPPFVLYYYGDISLLNNKFSSIAVVGSRLCSEYGITLTIL